MSVVGCGELVVAVICVAVLVFYALLLFAAATGQLPA